MFNSAFSFTSCMYAMYEVGLIRNLLYCGGRWPPKNLSKALWWELVSRAQTRLQKIWFCKSKVSNALNVNIIILGHRISLAGLLPSATKLGQGNIYRSVCQEFCPQGGGVHGRVAWGGGGWGHAWWGGVHGRGHAWQGHAWQGDMCDRGRAWQGACMAGGHAWCGDVWWVHAQE